MRIVLLAAVTAAALLTGCGQSADNPAANTAAPKSGQVLPITDNHTMVAARPPATKAAALKLMHERHEGMEDIGDAFKVLGREVKAGSPNLAKVRSSAATIAGLAPKVSSWFPPGTGPDVGKTMAKPEIWQKPADFAAKAKDFRGAALAFNATAKVGDINAIKAGFGELGKTCKACHDLYRAEKH